MELNANEKANIASEETFNPKVKNILRRLDDAGLAGHYTYVAQFDTLTVAFAELSVVVVCDLSSEPTDEQHFEAIMFRRNAALTA